MQQKLGVLLVMVMCLLLLGGVYKMGMMQGKEDARRGGPPQKQGGSQGTKNRINALLV